MKKCQSCNYENSDVMNFCLECGSALAEVPKMVVPIEGAETEDINASEIQTDSFEKETVVDNDRFGFNQSVPTYVHSEKPGSNTKIYIAIAAVTHVGQLDFVIVKTEQGAVCRYVRLGQRGPDERIEVASGLKAGEQVLIAKRLKF